MRLRRLLFVLLIVAALPGSVLAVQPDEILADAALEKRARGLSAGLRCLVCQNQSIDDSDAPLARDLRLLVRERLTAGESDQQVIEYVVKRYGEFVLLKPPFEPATRLLWVAPFLLLLGGIAFMWSRRRGAETAPIGLTTEEKSQLEAILKRRDL